MSTTDTKPISKTFKGKWQQADLAQVFADQMALIVVEDRVYLTFGQTRLPILDRENTDEKVDANVVPVSSLIVPVSTARKIAQLLQMHVPKEK